MQTPSSDGSNATDLKRRSVVRRLFGEECNDNSALRIDVESSSSESEIDYLPALQKSTKVSSSTDTEKKLSGKKNHSCLFCGQLVKTLTRHLKLKHFNEESVKLAMQENEDLKKQGLRASAFASLRKMGDAKYNLQREKGCKILVRKAAVPDSKLICCVYCQGYYSTKSFSRHLKMNCSSKSEKKVKNVTGVSRIKGMKVHPLACAEYITDFLPFFTKEEQLSVLTSDATAIYYANKLIEKHYKTNLGGKHIYISSQLRLLADIFNSCKKTRVDVLEIKDLFHPKMYDTVILAIRDRAGLEGNTFRAPSTATASCTLLFKVAELLICNSIKGSDEKTQTNIEKFLYLLKKMQNTDITKVALDNQTQFQRSKKIELPTTAEITALLSHLDHELDMAFDNIKLTFDIKSYENLCQIVLAYLLVFNRKRPGDLQKTQVKEFKNMVGLTNEIIEQLPEAERPLASKFQRFIAQGKLNKKSSCLLPLKIRDAVDFMLTHRHKVGISDDNTYLFANPGAASKRVPYYTADRILKIICNKYNLDPTKLSANNLRKHLATSTISLPEKTQNVISDFMGHSVNIHKSIYQQKDAYRDIVTMGEILDVASGNPNTNEAPAYGANGNRSKSAECTINNYQLESINQLEEDENDDSGVINIPEISSRTSTGSEAPELIIKINKLESIVEHKSDDSEVLNRPGTSKRTSMLKTPNKNLSRNQKRTWATPERHSVRQYFKSYIEKGHVPSLEVIQSALANKELEVDRFPYVIQAWINNAIKRNQVVGERPLNCWTTPQKHALRKYFNKYICSGTYPSEAEVRQIKAKYKVFHSKAVRTIKSKIQHEINLRQKNGR